MKCERCGENAAKIRYTEYRDGEAKKLRICEECARALGFRAGAEESSAEGSSEAGPPSPAPPGPGKGMILGIISIEATLGPAGSGGGSEADRTRCPGCGITGAELRTQPLFGCPECYETFAAWLGELLKKVHGAVTHRGRLPGGSRADSVDVRALRRELDEAIAREDFEAAARIRDRLGEPAPDPEVPEDPEREGGHA